MYRFISSIKCKYLHSNRLKRWSVSCFCLAGTLLSGTMVCVMFCSLLYLLLMESRWPTLEHLLASLCSSAYLRGGSILIVAQGPICKKISFNKLSFFNSFSFYSHLCNYNNIYLHINVEWTVGFNWNTWLLTAKLCSNLNGGSIIPSLTGNVNRSSSSENNRNNI